MNFTLMVHELKLRMEVSAADGATLIGAAQRIWAESFQIDRRIGLRSRERHYWVAGKLARNSAVKLTEAERLRRRRASFDAVSKLCRSLAVEAADRRLSAAHDETGVKRKLMAFELGACLAQHPSAKVTLAKKKKLTKYLAVPAGALERQVGCTLSRLMFALGPCSLGFICDGPF